MQILVDLMIGSAAFLAAAYCMLLSRRLRALTRLDGDVGKAIAVLSQQVDALTEALKAAEKSNSRAGLALSEQIAQADSSVRQLELLMAAHRSSGAYSVKRENDRPSRERPHHDADADAPDFEPLDSMAHRAGADQRRRVMRQRERQGDAR